MSEIENPLRQEITRGGPVSFARFMEMALYCPKIGYYERDPGVIGLSSDFYTSSSVGPLFGHLLAIQFASWSVDRPLVPLCWVEAGAHDGTLALSILDWLGKNRPDLLDRLTYVIIEPSASRRLWQEQKLRNFTWASKRPPLSPRRRGRRSSADFGQVRWVESFEELSEKPLNGIIFSNELLDSFPVHRLVWDRSRLEWFERGVTLAENQFTWTKIEQPSIDIEAELRRAGFDLREELLAVLPDAFTIDLSPAAADWWSHAARTLSQGRLLTIDYGYSAEELLRPERSHGTLRAYYRQRISDDVLARPGEQDLTAHVNFTQLQLAGESAGLETEVLTTQEQFLGTIVQQSPGSRDWSAAQVRQYQSLTHPEHLGRSFRVLVQSRSAEA